MVHFVLEPKKEKRAFPGFNFKSYNPEGSDVIIKRTNEDQKGAIFDSPVIVSFGDPGDDKGNLITNKKGEFDPTLPS